MGVAAYEVAPEEEEEAALLLLLILLISCESTFTAKTTFSVTRGRPRTPSPWIPGSGIGGLFGPLIHRITYIET